jgi:phosphoribosylformylglycinamidine synthase
VANHEIREIRVSPTGSDSLGDSVKAEAERTLGLQDLEAVRTTKVYRLQGVTREQADRLATELFTDPITEQSIVGDRDEERTGHTVEVAYKPGVMNPGAESIVKAALDLDIQPKAADSSVEYHFSGQITESEVDEIVGSLLVNKTVQQIVTAKPGSLTFEGKVGPVNTIPIREMTPEGLDSISKDKLFLSQEEMQVIKVYFEQLGRDPTDCELEIIAARWSEHCGHKTFEAKVVVNGVEKEPLFSRIKGEAKKHFGELIVSAFEDNSGVMRLYEGQAICGKVETHNSPSAIEPYGGAMTGSGGVFRDTMGTGQGAKTIISTDMFCFAPPDLDSALLPPGTLHPDYLQRRVVDGVRDYGNRMGIPTANGSVHYDKDFRAKPSVIVGAYGIMPESRVQKGEPQIGDMVVIIGGRTGRDGIHGATFSSGEMTDETINVNSSAVQIGNAIEEKRMSDALLEARDEDLIRALTDCGAAGLSSAIGEMGENIGVTVDISKTPLKYEGLAPWEIWLSESQERMTAAIAPENIEAFMALCQKYNVEATVLGEFDGSHILTVNYGDQNVAELDYDFLQNGLPQRVMYAHWEREDIQEIRPNTPETPTEWIQRVKDVLSHGNVCSKEPIVRQYDHGVQGGNIVPPFGGINQDGPNDALVIRPMLDRPYGIVQSHGMNPILNRLNPYEGSVWAVAEAVSNYVAVGGNPKEASLINNYIWPYPDERAMGSLDMSVDAVVDMMDVLEIPVISGKDSLSSTYRGKDGEVIEIPPVLCMSVFGRIPDVEKTTTSDIKKPGTRLFMIGNPSAGMGGSAYYDVTGGSSGEIPRVDKNSLPTVFQAVHRGIESGYILSCHDVSEGGTITTVAEMCFGGDCGATIVAPTFSLNSKPDEALFNETAGCFVVEIPDGVDPIKAFPGATSTFLGRTQEDKTIEVRHQNESLFTVPTDELKQAWKAPVEEIFH